MTKRFLFIIFCLAVSSVSTKVWADATFTDNVIGKTITSHSKVLNEERQIKVYLPPSYHDSAQDYPVLYVLDGQWHFLNAVAVQHALKSPLATPEMIVVGVMNRNPDRRTWYGEKSEEFEQYLLTEVVPFVDKSYRTQERKILFGWEMSAFFAGDLLVKHPNLFEGMVLSNGGEISEQALKDLGKKIKNDHYLYIGNSDRDVYTVRYGEWLSENLAKADLSNIHWQYEKMNQETHQSTPYLSLYKGLKHIFHNYVHPEFVNVKEYHQRGGMTYLNQYFESRAKRFGFDNAIAEQTQNHLIWLTWKQDNYQDFDKFMTEFSEVLATKRYDSVFWHNNFGQYYLKHGNTKKAEHFFSKGISKFPKSAKLHHGLGKVYAKSGLVNKAKKQLRTAIEIATATNDRKLTQYKQDLEGLN